MGFYLYKIRARVFMCVSLCVYVYVDPCRAKCI